MRACESCGYSATPSARFCGQCGEMLPTQLCVVCNTENLSSHRFCDQCGYALQPHDHEAEPVAIATPHVEVYDQFNDADDPNEISTLMGVASGLHPFENDHDEAWTRLSGSIQSEPPALPVLKRVANATTTAIASAERKLATVLFADVVGYTTMAEHADPEVVATTVDAALRRMTDVVHKFGGTIDKYMGDALMAVFGVPRAHDDDPVRAIAAALELVGLSDFAGELSLSIGINTGDVMVMSIGGEGQTTVIGDAVNVAARLEKVAGAGQVLMGPLTAELAGNRALLRQRSAVTVKGKSDSVDVWEAIAMNTSAASLRAHDRSDFIGRTEESMKLLKIWKEVCDSREPRIVRIAGAGGIGKSRLIREFISEISHQARTVYSSHPAYGTVIAGGLVRDLLSQLGYTGDEQIDERLQSLTGQVSPTLRTLDPKSLEREGLWGLAQFLQTKAVLQPVVVALDDLHRATRRHAEFLSELFSRLHGVPIFVIVCGRDEPSAWLDTIKPINQIVLEPLSRSDSMELLQTIAHDDALNDRTIFAVLERAGGNPLYLRELLAVASDTNNFTAHGSPAAAIMPPTLKSVLAARLDAMTANEKLCIQHIAVLGEGASQLGVEILGPRELSSVVQSLCKRGVVRTSDAGMLEVSDPLLAEVAYETLPRHVRGERHRAAAEASDNIGDRARHLALVAEFLPEDRDARDDAALANSFAGLQCLQNYQLVEGVEFLERAVALGHRVPEDLLALSEALSQLERHEDALQMLTLAGSPAR